MWWKIMLGIGVYLGIGIVIGNRMFDYPVGSFWHVMVAMFWPILLFLK